MRVAFRYDDRRLLSRLVCWWQGHDAAHCEVVVGERDGVYECGSASWTDGGVRIKSMPLPVDRWRVYTVQGDARIAHSWFMTHYGDKYDLLGLAGFVFRPVKGWLSAWFCSEVGALHMGLPDPWRYDVAALESVCRKYGTRTQ